MTREEAKSCIGTIEMLQRLAYNIHGVMDVVDADNCKNIIKALEQQPCEDCISRQAVLALPTSKTRTLSGEIIEEEVNIELIKALPSVVPKEKTGRWIVHPIYAHLVCSKCLSGAPYDYKTNFCPNCGARMIEPQESEEI